MEEKVNPEKTDRLCNEIQLFDLCDLDSCNYKQGRFCTDSDLLRRFEAIKEEDERSNLVYEEEELEDGQDEGSEIEEDYDDSFEDE